MTTYTLTRRGTVHNEEIGPYKCGRVEDNLIQYEVEIKVKDLELDSRGFMIEHQDLHETMRDVLVEDLSCEKMAGRAKSRLLTLLESRGNLTVVSIKVSIGEKRGKSMFTIEHREPQERTLTLSENPN